MKARDFHGGDKDQSLDTRTNDAASGGLRSLVRPRYFGGQSLKSDDMMALVDWARDRFALQRLRTGWGVVCGMQVETQPNVPDGVVVRPGFAVDACGTDIVVPCSEAVSLTGKCRETTASNCGNGIQQPSPATDFPESESVTPQQTTGQAAIWPPGELGELVPVDLFLYSKTANFHPRPALATGSCQQTSDCDYARTQEKYEICTRRGEDAPDPCQHLDQKYRDWEKRYLDECFRALEDLFFPSGSDFREWTTGLYSTPEGRRPQTMAFLRGLLQADAETRESDRTALLFAVLQDRRNAFFAQDCAIPNISQGVPIARVWMRTESNNQCSIVYIDNFPPFRRELTLSKAPARFGEINLSPYIWMHWKEASRRLSEVGLPGVKPNELGDFAGFTPKKLWDFFVHGEPAGDRPLELQESLSSACGQQLEMFYLNTRFGPRVVAFKAEVASTQAPWEGNSLANAVSVSDGGRG